MTLTKERLEEIRAWVEEKYGPHATVGLRTPLMMRELLAHIDALTQRAEEAEGAIVKIIDALDRMDRADIPNDGAGLASILGRIQRLESENAELAAAVLDWSAWFDEALTAGDFDASPAELELQLLAVRLMEREGK